VVSFEKRTQGRCLEHFTDLLPSFKQPSNIVGRRRLQHTQMDESTLLSVLHIFATSSKGTVLTIVVDEVPAALNTEIQSASLTLGSNGVCVLFQ
jgi:hypothetical protein